jgi:lipopolysaccharide transport system ATP-binding protein
MQPIIEIHDLSKRYQRSRAGEKPNSLREALVGACKSPFRYFRQRAVRDTNGFFYALRDIDLRVQTGEVVGVIGSNGAGKSTLLKILSRITEPTAGHIVVRGRMTSLLEVGTGFHPELTGRENIFLNGAIMGMKRHEIQSRFDEIVAFSEVEEFLDLPVKRYSSGMYVRLAFAVAAHLQPEILVVDEVLAVGDVAFQKKCMGKMSDVSKQGRTVFFVSHNMAAVENLCTRGVVLERGHAVYDGPVSGAVQRYLLGVPQMAGAPVVDLTKRSTSTRTALCFRKLEIDTGAGGNPGSARLGERVSLRITVELNEPSTEYDVHIGIDNLFGERILTCSTYFDPKWQRKRLSGASEFICSIESLTLFPGEYRLRLVLTKSDRQIDAVEDAARLSILHGDYFGTGRPAWSGKFVLRQSWTAEQSRESSSDSATCVASESVG